jgi:hypothetical protein
MFERQARPNGGPPCLLRLKQVLVFALVNLYREKVDGCLGCGRKRKITINTKMAGAKTIKQSRPYKKFFVLLSMSFR